MILRGRLPQTPQCGLFLTSVFLPGTVFEKSTREFALGEARDHCEWRAEIYMDVDLREENEDLGPCAGGDPRR